MRPKELFQIAVKALRARKEAELKEQEEAASVFENSPAYQAVMAKIKEQAEFGETHLFVTTQQAEDMGTNTHVISKAMRGLGFRSTSTYKPGVAFISWDQG